uniref:Uncharacterized protein n=1 Tax=Amphilophus citrinellus TaxID=61819 RepID=A0A3Q0RIY3_AMPCI
MKCTVIFLVLSMVILLAQPGECILGMILAGAAHSTFMLIHGKQNLEAQEQLDKRGLNYKLEQPGFD